MLYLTPAQASDIPELMRIAAEAFKNNALLHVEFKFDPETGYSQYLAEQLQIWLKTGTFRVVMAKDSQLDHVCIGWTCWEHHGYTSYDCELFNEVHEMNEGDRKFGSVGDELNPVMITVAEIDEVSETPAQTLQDEATKASNLSDFKLRLDSDMQHWARRLRCRTSKCLQMRILAVLPEHQSNRLGSRLVRWGTRGADKDNEFCWLRCPASLMPFFAKCGFIRIGEMKIKSSELDFYHLKDEREEHDPRGRTVVGKSSRNLIYVRRTATRSSFKTGGFGRGRKFMP